MKTNVNYCRSKIPAVHLLAMILLTVGCSSPGTSRYFSQAPLPSLSSSHNTNSSSRVATYGQLANAPIKPSSSAGGWRVEGAGHVVRGQQADGYTGGYRGVGQAGDVQSTISDSELDLGLGSGAVLDNGQSWSEPYPDTQTADLDVILNEARTGRFSIGMGVNSDAGLSGQIIVDERNFDWTAIPTSFDDIANGRAFRGGGQGFRLEALPGRQFQRYLLSFSEPYLWGTPISFSLSGYFFDRRYDDWDEQRLGGRFGFGYRLTPDLSATMALRMENVTVHNPRVGPGVVELDEVLGDNSLFSAQFTLSHDTRDIPFAPTEGHFLELSFTQAFGTFSFPRAEMDYRLYYLLRERPDGSGRHTLAYSFRTGFSGGNTPLFENYFAGGYSTLRGFDFRGASPQNMGVTVGGEFRFLGSVEYFFPLTADDMVKGVAFCDFGTVEEKIAIHADDYRVAPGIGLRLSIPAMGPAPIALDFAIPVAKEDTDRRRSFSFFFGYTRGG
ncbi:MAG: BamA/TamA family outer membrane protein [Pirellulaceae bacterium]|nr:hypothetical protein [Planctomycetaceae bacterium]